MSKAFRNSLRLISVLLLSAAGLLGVRAVLVPAATREKVVAVPFTLTEEAASPPDGAAFARWTIARRSDGSTMQVENVPPLRVVKPLVRSIHYIDGSGMSLSDSLGIRWKHEPLWGRNLSDFRNGILEPPDNCVMGNSEQLVGFRQIAGERVAVVVWPEARSVWDRANKMQTVSSRAIDLACEELGYSIAEQSSVDGSWKLMTRAKLVSLKLGEPDARLFDVSPDLTEVTRKQFEDSFEQSVIKTNHLPVPQ